MVQRVVAKDYDLERLKDDAGQFCVVHDSAGVAEILLEEIDARSAPDDELEADSEARRIFLADIDTLRWLLEGCARRLVRPEGVWP